MNYKKANYTTKPCYAHLTRCNKYIIFWDRNICLLRVLQLFYNSAVRDQYFWVCESIKEMSTLKVSILYGVSVYKSIKNLKRSSLIGQPIKTGLSFMHWHVEESWYIIDKMLLFLVLSIRTYRIFTFEFLFHVHRSQEC